VARCATCAFALLAGMLAMPAASAQADCVVLADVPDYYWYHGCSPTAGMMVLGYWDACGYANLIPGPNTPSGTVNDLIASPQHIADHALYNGVNDSGYASPYPDKSSLGGAHASNCLADFMYTSESSAGNTYGLTFVNQIAAGMARYATWKGYSFTGNDIWINPPQWSDFIREIQFGRPVVLSVDTNGNNTIDHSVAAIGCRTTATTSEYLCRDTYGGEAWYPFTPLTTAGQPYAVGAMGTLRPASTSDSTWKGASGASWNTSTNWQGATVPTASTFVWLPSTAQVTATSSAAAMMLQLQGGLNIQNTMALGTLRVLGGGSVTLTAGTPRLSVSSAFFCDGLIAQSTGTVAASADLVVRLGMFTQSGGTDTVSGLLDVQGDYEFTGGSLTAGRLAVEAGGRFATGPGAAQAGIHFTDLTLAPTSTLGAGIAGTAAGTQYNTINCSAAAALGGATLDLRLLYDPQIGDRYTLLGGGSPVSGTFAGLVEGALFERENPGSHKSYLLHLTYAGGAGADVAIENLAPVGDGNGDGAVNGLDYNVWQNGYARPSPTFWTGDYNLNGVVDGLDYNVWQNMYALAMGMADGVPGPVPEPATLALVALVAALAAARRRAMRA